MGYSRRYLLSIKQPDPIFELVNTNPEAGFVLEMSGEPKQSGKWYEHEKDLLEFSKLYPNTLFVLSSEGEETSDIWRKYFINGKLQVAQAKIILEEFDHEKLK